MKKQMRTLLAAGAFAVAGAVTAQAADITPVTGHWTKLGADYSALVYYIDEPDGFHVVVTTQQGRTSRRRSSGSRRCWRRDNQPRSRSRAPRAKRRSGLYSAMPATTCTSPNLPPPLWATEDRPRTWSRQCGAKTSEPHLVVAVPRPCRDTSSFS
jgi:hypothetical protein